MLPVKAGSLLLSDESRTKLDLYYQRFCEGGNGLEYGISHIIFACHAAFPLILSPSLANLIWLNFNTYKNGDGLHKIDRIVVSDFLLSPLVRPVANRQFEVIPEIRNYLLYLLKDSRWFQLFGIEKFGDKRLDSLARFLRQYLADSRSNTENNASGFKEINEWAALAYLQPDLLAFKLATAFQKTFSNVSDEPDNEHAQLRLNMLMDRFGQQIDMDISDGDQESTKAFINIRRYSKANKARLFDKKINEVSDLYFQVDDAFIEAKTIDQNLVQLPLKKDFGNRLERKKKGIQKIFALMVAIDEYETPGIAGSRSRVAGCKYLSNALQQINRRNDFDIQHKLLLNKDATAKLIENALDEILNEANNEDIILIYLAGQFTIGQRQDFLCYDSVVTNMGPAPSNTITPKYLNDKFRSSGKGCSKVLLLEGDVSNIEWKLATNFLFTAVRDVSEHVADTEFNGEFLPVYSRVLADALIENDMHLTNYDMQKIIRFKIRTYLSQNNFPINHPVCWLDDTKNANSIFLKNKVMAGFPGSLLAYNEKQAQWQVLEEDFKSPALNTTSQIFNYDNQNLGDLHGEILFNENAMQFNGMTSSLDTGKIYKVMSARTSLYLGFKNESKYPAEKALFDKVTNELGDELLKIELNEFSKWGNLKRYEIQNDETYNNFSDKLQIEPVFTEDIISHYKINFFPAINFNEKIPGISWLVSDKNLIGESIPKFAQYHYLSTLKWADQNNVQTAPLKINFNCEWEQTQNRGSGTGKDQEFLLDEKCFNIENGNVVFNSLNIKLLSEEPFPIYFDVYIMFSNFAIKKIVEGEVMDINPIKRLTIPGKEWIENILLEEVSVQVKILFSRDPVMINFSQSGI